MLSPKASPYTPKNTPSEGSIVGRRELQNRNIFEQKQGIYKQTH